ncbi:MAG: PQQ-binding-like beta-propeller repeat protein [Planctomycetaceae bacterium]
MSPKPQWTRVCGVVALTVCWTPVQAQLRAADWSAFRGANHQGTTADSKIPTEWSDSKNLGWKLELPGRGFSSPIVVGQSVFVTTYTSRSNDLKDLKRHLVCIDRQTGKISWSKGVESSTTQSRGASFGTRHGFASHTPVSDGERVYVFFGNSGVIAFDLQGQQLWQTGVGTESASMFGSAASPILHKDHVIVTAASESESIRALDKKTGKEVWKAEAGTLSRCYATPVIAQDAQGQDIVLISVPYELWGVNPANGKLKWYAETEVDTNSCPSVVTHDGIAYVIGGRAPGGRAAVRIGGKGDVTKSNVLWSTTGGSYVPSPVLYQSHLYWVDDRGVAHCIDATSGKETNKKRLRGQFYASMLLVRDKLYAVSRFSGTHVLEATPKLTQVASNTLDDESDFSASPAVSNGQLFLRSEKFLYCVQTTEK